MGIPFDAWCADHTPGTSSADGLVRTTTEALFRAIDENREAIDQDPARVHVLVDETVMPYVDLPKISRWILGKQWRRASPSQRQRFMGEFRILLVRSYATAVSQNTDVAITYRPVRLKKGGEEATVSTRIHTRSEQPLDIIYRLHKSQKGWKLFDVVVAGVSLVATYRSTFAAEIKRVGIDGLIDQLASKNSAPAQSAPEPNDPKP
jgi:phospholipid transport system substrate-binding protein